MAADGSTSYDCRHLFGVTCGIPEPVFRSKLRATVNVPGNIQFSVNWRHLSGVYVDAASPNGFLSGTVYTADRRIPSFNYFDLSTAIRVADKFSLRVGANNLLDKDPPIVSSNSLSSVFGNGNTYPQVYDAQGRYIFAGVTVDF